MLVGTIAFASFFIFISVNKSTETAEAEFTESNTNKANTSQGEYILESFVGSILIGTN